MAEFVYIKKDGIEALGGPVTRAALEKVHSPKGWREATPDEVTEFQKRKHEVVEAARTLTAEDLNAIRKRSDLEAIALERGIDPTQHENMDALKAAVAETL